MSIVMRMTRGKLRLTGMAMFAMMLLPGVGHAQSSFNWGPPYVNSGWVADSVGYQTIPEAVAATVAEVAATCTPNPCTTKVIYFEDPLHNSTAVEVVGHPDAPPATATFIDGSLQLQDPLKNAGGCETCKEHNGGHTGGSSPKHSSGDAATDSGSVAGSTRVFDPINAATGASTSKIQIFGLQNG